MTTTTTAPPRMDPRLRERRVAVKRDEGRRRLRFLAIFVGVLMLFGVGAAATRSRLLDVDLIEVTGAHHVPASTLLDTGGIHRRDLMIDLVPHAAAKRMEGLSWVASADVHRAWPGTVQVHVVERHAVAAVAMVGNRWATVDAGGRVLERTATSPPGLPVLLGVPALAGDRVPARLHDALAVAAAIPARLVARVPGVVLHPDGLELALQPHGVVRFGGPERAGEKLTALETLLDRVEGGIAVIDLRVPDAPVLTRG